MYRNDRFVFGGVLVLLALVVSGCGGPSATPNVQAAVRAAVTAQMATLTAAVPTPNYPATIQAQATQIAGLQGTLTVPTSPPPPTSTPDDATAIRNALAAYLGWPPSQVQMEIGQQRGDVAEGVVKHVGDMEGAAWFAAKTEGVWVIAYVGLGVPPCDRVNPLNIPTDWADYCVQGGQIIHR